MRYLQTTSGKVSIICPVYNSENTLSNCLNSILSQSYTNWECLIVIDGARDSSECIARRFAAIDSRFVLIIQDNKGRSAARNHGIAKATGDWITFIDSDDELSFSGLSAMMNLARIYKPDIVYGNYIVKSETSKGQTASCSENGILDLSYARIANLNIERLDMSMDGYQYDIYNCRTCWAKLYSRQLLNNNIVRFPERLRFSEDLLFNYYALSNAVKAVYTNDVVYIYNDSSDGTVRSFSSKDFLSVYAMSQIVEQQFCNNPIVLHDFQACVARDYLGVFLRGSNNVALCNINQVCTLARECYTPFIRQSLLYYCSRNMKTSKMKYLYNKIRIALIRHQFWRSAFLFQRIGCKLK